MIEPGQPWMIGTILNVVGIVLGGILGLTLRRDLSTQNQTRLKYILGVLLIYMGMVMTWKAIGGSFGHLVKQLFIIMISLVLGNALGLLLRLQRGLNVLGKSIQSLMDNQGHPNTRFSQGFLTCSLLFCVGPLAILGSILDGLDGNYRVLGIKACMDCLAAMALARSNGWSVLLSGLPVLAWQGSITLAARSLAPWVQNHALIDPINATGGALLLCISMVVLSIVKVPLANYLPSLIVAPLLAAWWGW